METQARRVEYQGIILGLVLMMGIILIQPAMNQAYAVGQEQLPSYDNCRSPEIREDPISMNTVRSGNIVKTIHAEKEIFASSCHLEQGGLPVIVDLTTYIELYQNINDREVIKATALVVTCIKDIFTATVIDCESSVPPSTPVPVGSDCYENRNITHPQEMNTVNKGSIAKTIEAQKEIFICELGVDACSLDVEIMCPETGVVKKVEVILFTDIYEDLSTQTVEEVQFHSMRCVILVTDFGDDLPDGTVETCQFSTIQN
jgi:hypothetical protein